MQQIQSPETLRRVSVQQSLLTMFKTMPFQQLMLMLLCFTVLLRTVAPTIYYLVDSSEYAVGVSTLGIVHAPGYGLYLFLGHLFTLLPIGELAYELNLFSAVCLSLAAACCFGLIAQLTGDRVVAAAASLIFVWSYYVWMVGVAAEVYAPQLALLAAFGWVLAILHRQEHQRDPYTLLAGVLYGLAVALNPTSIFFAPGVVIAFRLMRISWRMSIFAGCAALLIFVGSLAYFPLRYAAQPAFNVAGSYAADGSFNPVDLQTLQGIWWLIRGAQFEGFFFSQGIIPTVNQVLQTITLFGANFLGIGLIIGVIGAVSLYHRSRRGFIIWLSFFLPYTYFYTTYGAVDRDTMFGPSHLLWTILIAYGLQWFTESAGKLVKYSVVMALPLLMLGVNFATADASQITEVRERAEKMIAVLPEDAIVFGNWLDIITLQYLQLVEHQRPDVTLYNLYYFDDRNFNMYLTNLATQSEQPVIFLSGTLDNQAKTDFLNLFYELEPISSNDVRTDNDSSGVIIYLLTGVRSTQ